MIKPINYIKLVDKRDTSSRARGLARIGRRPSKPEVRGSNPRGPATYHLYIPKPLLSEKRSYNSKFGQESRLVLASQRMILVDNLYFMS